MRRVLIPLPENSVNELIDKGTCINCKSHGYYVYDQERPDADLLSRIKDSCKREIKDCLLFEISISNTEENLDIRNIVSIYRVRESIYGYKLELFCNLRGDSIFSEYSNVVYNYSE